MRGAAKGSGHLMRTWPRDVGRRLHTEGVIAGNGCSGSPNLSRRAAARATRCSRLGCAGVALRERAQLRGRHRERPASGRGGTRAPMSRLARTGCWRARSAWRLWILHTMRICRWSWRFSPTPGRSWTTGMPCACSSAAGADAGELQELRRDPMAPAASTTSRRAGTCAVEPSARRISTPGRAPGAVAALDDHPRDVRVGEDGQVRPTLDGAEEGADHVTRTPRRWLTWK